MKKLSILTAFLCVSVFTFAQAIVDPIETDAAHDFSVENPTAVINQSNLPGDPLPTGTVEATVKQQGKNYANVQQDNNSSEGSLSDISATVQQIYTGRKGDKANSAVVYQSVQDDVDPGGSILTTSAIQVGDKNKVTQKQVNDRPTHDFMLRDFKAKQTGSNNEIVQESTDGDQGSVYFDAEQVGKRNYAEQITNMAGGSTASEDGSKSTMDILQKGNDNKAMQSIQSLDATGDIQQYGNKNEAKQTFGNLTKENHGIIIQGEEVLQMRGPAPGAAVENYAEQEFSGKRTLVSNLTATQKGTGNYSVQKVDGEGQEAFEASENDGTVTQFGTRGDISKEYGNEALQVFTGKENSADIKQDGFQNNAEQDVQGDGNALTTSQFQTNNPPSAPVPAPTLTMELLRCPPGDDEIVCPDFVENDPGNFAYQIATGNDNGEQYANIFQDGNRNKGEQFFNGDENNAEIRQVGINLTAKQTFDGSGNFAKIDQTNEKNRASQTIEGMGNGVVNPILITQVGTYGQVDQSILGEESTGNEMTAYQDGWCNLIEQNTTGSNNESYVRQEADARKAKAYVDQEGDGNYVMLSQDIDDSKADIYQMGDDNCVMGLGGMGTAAINNNSSELLIDQLGNENEAYVLQDQRNSFANLDQNGFGNVATIIQSTITIIE